MNRLVLFIKTLHDTQNELEFSRSTESEYLNQNKLPKVLMAVKCDLSVKIKKHTLWQ